MISNYFDLCFSLSLIRIIYGSLSGTKENSF